MEFRQKTLGNGLQLIGELNPAAKSAAVGFFVRTGSRDEDPNINGVSHFLEHMLFKGTERLSALEVNAAFDNTGAQFNACTSEENTIYYAAVLPEYLEEVTQLWIELMRPSLREDDFSIEKHVIKEEIAMYKDLPHYEVFEKCRVLHFEGHPCGNSVLGTEAGIEALTSRQMRDYFGRRYVPKNIVAAWAGQFDWDRVCAVMDAACPDWTGTEAPRSVSHYQGSFQHQSLTDGKLACEHLCLMSEAVSAQDPRRYAASLLATIVGDDLGSRYYWQLVDKAIAETASMQYSAMDGTGALCSYFRCNPGHSARVRQVLATIFQQLERDGVTEGEVQMAKNKILSALVLRNEIPMGRLMDLGSNWVYLGKYQPIDQEVAAVKAVQADQVNSLIRELRPGVFTQFAIGPGQLT